MFWFLLLAFSTSVIWPTATIAPQGFSATPPSVHFVDIAARAGLTARTEDGGEKSKKYIIETTGSGAAFFDYDNDGWPDIFLLNGTTLEPRAGSPPATSQLYHNNHEGAFTNVTKQAGAGVAGCGPGVGGGD